MLFILIFVLGVGHVSAQQESDVAYEHKAHAVQSLTKNFASCDCGAKVVGWNPEASGADHVISPDRDEYLLSKCSDKTWFVVELCESVKALKVQLANFELYSSTPHMFRVSMSNTYPGRKSDWVVFGEFAAENKRAEQSFIGQGTFGKYAKVEILSHHRNEHFCPISMFAVYGISAVEMIGADYDGDDDLAPDLLERTENEDYDLAQDLPERTKKDDDDLANASEGTDNDGVDIVSQNLTVSDNKGIINYVKEVIQIVFGVFSPHEQVSSADMEMALNASSLGGTSLKYEVICPECDSEGQQDVFLLLSAKYKSLKDTLKVTSLRRSLERGFCQSLGMDFSFQNNSLTCTFSLARKFYETLFGTSRTIALCNVIAAENSVLPLSRTPEVLNVSTGNSAPNDTSSNQSQEVEGKAPAEVKSDVKNGTHSSEDLSHVAEKDGDSEQGQVPLQSEPTPDSPQEASPIPGDNLPPPNDSKNREPPVVVHVPPLSADHISVDPASPTVDAKSGNNNYNKGPVWQRLSSKIKVLEQNMTLFGGHLEELSARYKKQIEDLQESARQAGEAIGSLSSLQEEARQAISILQEEAQFSAKQCGEALAVLKSRHEENQQNTTLLEQIHLFLKQSGEAITFLSSWQEEPLNTLQQHIQLYSSLQEETISAVQQQMQLSANETISLLWSRQVDVLNSMQKQMQLSAKQSGEAVTMLSSRLEQVTMRVEEITGQIIQASWFVAVFFIACFLLYVLDQLPMQSDGQTQQRKHHQLNQHQSGTGKVEHANLAHHQDDESVYCESSDGQGMPTTKSLSDCKQMSTTGIAKLQPGHRRARSTSPPRAPYRRRLKHFLMSFDPEKADWLKKKT